MEYSSENINKFPNLLVCLKNKNKTKSRLILKDYNFLNKTIEEIDSEIKIVSNFYDLDNHWLKNVYFDNTGDWRKVLSFLANKSTMSHWSQIEDEIILSENLDQIEEVIKRRGLEEVMKRRIFLKTFNKIKSI
jgi:hypothetical protein